MAQCAVVVVRGIFLGRDREVAELGAALDDLARGNGSLVLVTGEPGIGKTRLADEAARAARERGVMVHWGRAWEAGGAPSYWPFIQVLRSICRALDDVTLRAATALNGGELAALMPELRARLPELPKTNAGDDRERFELFDGIDAMLHVVGAATPLMIVLDDLHAADPSSLLLLRFLVRDLRSRRLLVVGTFREAEARLSPATRAALVPIAREATTLPLRRLAREEVASYIAHATGATPKHDDVDAVHRQTEGNPLFLRELLKLRGDPAVAARRADGIREVVRARLALSSDTVRAVLEAAAALGRELDTATLALLCEMTESAVTTLLAPAADAGIVEPLETPNRFRFTHVLLREALHDGMPAARRASLHRAAAFALSRRGDSSLAEIAHHLLEAMPAVSPVEAADAAMRAASRAMELLAFEDARDLLVRAVSLLEDSPGEDRRLFEARLALGLARIRAGDADEGRATCLRAVDLARSIDDGALFARAVLGSAYEFTPGVRNGAVIALLEEALAKLPPGDGALRARCLSQLAAERQPEPDTAPPIELARSAIAMARRVGDASALRFTLTAAGLASMVYGDPDERIALDRETLHLALASGDKRVALRAHLLLVNDHADKGDRDAARAHARSYAALASELGGAAHAWLSRGLEAAYALDEGRFDDARALFDECIEGSRHDQSRGTSMAATPVLFACFSERYDDAASIEQRVRASFAPHAHELGGCIGEMLLAKLHGHAGDRARAALQLAAVREHPCFAEIVEPVWLVLLVDAVHLLRDVALAARLYPLILPRAERVFGLGHLGPAWGTPYHRDLGLLAQTLGRMDDAVVHLEKAVAATERGDLRGLLARVRWDLAGALSARNAPGDAARATDLVTSARALAEDLGQTSLVARIAPASRPAPRASPTSVAFTLTREGDVWTIAHGERVARLRDSRGLSLLERLVTAPGQELHVLMLASSSDAVVRGDAGEALDATAVQSYRRRLLDLREELEEAEGFCDRGRADRAQREIDALTQELARAVGLGGRSRRTGDPAERARTAVQKRLRDAIRRIQDELPELGTHLEQTIRTGAFCGYFPSGRPRR